MSRGVKQEIQTSDWMMSVDAEQSDAYGELLSHVSDTYYSYVPYIEILEGGPSRYIDFEDEESVHEWQVVAEEYLLPSEVYEESDEADRASMLAAWQRPEVDWLYGDRRVKADKMSRFVLSGILGDRVLLDPDVCEQAGVYGLSPLDTAILAGGVALAARTKARIGQVGTSYLSNMHSEEVAEIWTGGDIHGDFQSSWHLRSLQDVTTSLQPERRHAFMPVPEKEWAVGSHSIELRVVMELLLYLVKQGKDPAAIHAEITKTIGISKPRGGGPYADFGSDDGLFMARELQYRLEDLQAKGLSDEASQEIILSHGPKLVLLEREGGVELANKKKGEEPRKGVRIPDDEVATYISSLLLGGGGRTSYGAMKQVVDALIENNNEDI